MHDGLRCYSQLEQADHQTCLTHLIRRCQEMSECATRAEAQFPLQVKTLLQRALLLDDRYERQEVTTHGLAVATGLLEAGMDGLLDKTYRSASNERLAKHLRQQRGGSACIAKLRTPIAIPQPKIAQLNGRGIPPDHDVPMIQRK